jgi:hypothetical protein
MVAQKQEKKPVDPQKDRSHGSQQRPGQQPRRDQGRARDEQHDYPEGEEEDEE